MSSAGLQWLETAWREGGGSGRGTTLGVASSAQPPSRSTLENLNRSHQTLLTSNIDIVINQYQDG